MQRVLAQVQKERDRYAQAPFFTFLKDDTVEPRQKLGFARQVAHFSMTFGDICAFVLPQEPATDKFQELVNNHAQEDNGHWRWYLKDLELLGEDRPLLYSDAIKLIWGDATIRTRKISYHLCRFAIGGDSLTRLVLVECIEGAFQVTLAGLLPPAIEFGKRTGKILSYMGPGHSEIETSHVLADTEVRRMLAETVLTAEKVDELCSMVEQVFSLFVGFSDDLLALSKAYIASATPSHGHA